MASRDASGLAAPRLVTCDPARATATDPLGVILDGVVVFDKRILDVGARAEILARHPGLRVDESRGVVTPGLVDAHTHAAWVGSRCEEYARRMAGADYEAIAAAGGGIAASMRATRDAAPDKVASAVRGRLTRMLSLGVTTVEVKSGYGLDEASERKQLEAVATVASDFPRAPRIVPTYLALHALPPEANGDRDGYAARVATEWLPRLATLARFVDVYVDRSAFSVAQARPVLEAAKALGLGVRLHVGQFADVGGAELAAEVGAASADHLEQVGPAGVAALARSGTRAVLLPVASLTLRQEPPPIAALRAAGVPLVVASDANPGTAPTESLPLAMALAVRFYGLTPAEAILGATREAAASLGLGAETGALIPGLAADLVEWDLDHENELILPWGASKAAWVRCAGCVVANGQLAPFVVGRA